MWDGNLKFRSFAGISVIFTVFLFLSIISFEKYTEAIPARVLSYCYTSYLYLHGHYYFAVGIWQSPLFSILLIPFLILSEVPFYAFHMLIVTIIFILNVEIFFLLKHFEIRNITIFLIILFLIPIAFSFIVFFYVSGLLIACFLFLELYIVFKDDYLESRWNAVICGVLGGAMYLSGSFGLPFFVISTTFFYLFFLFRHRINSIISTLIHYFITICILALICMFWTSLLSHKFKEVEFNPFHDYRNSLLVNSGDDGSTLRFHHRKHRADTIKHNHYFVKKIRSESYFKMEEKIRNVKSLISKIATNNINIIVVQFRHFSYYFLTLFITALSLLLNSFKNNKTKNIGKNYGIICFCIGLYIFGGFIVLFEFAYNISGLI